MTHTTDEATGDTGSLELMLLTSQHLHAARAEHARACAELAAAFLAENFGVHQLARHDEVVRSLSRSEFQLWEAEKLLPRVQATFEDRPYFRTVSGEALQAIDAQLSRLDLDLRGWADFREILSRGGFRQVFSATRHDCGVLRILSREMSVTLEYMAEGRSHMLHAALSADPENEFWEKHARIQRSWIDMQERMHFFQLATRELFNPVARARREADPFGEEMEAAAGRTGFLPTGGDDSEPGIIKHTGCF